MLLRTLAQFPACVVVLVVLRVCHAVGGRPGDCRQIGVRLPVWVPSRGPVRVGLSRRVRRSGHVRASGIAARVCHRDELASPPGFHPGVFSLRAVQISG